MGETLSDIIKTQVDDGHWRAHARAADGPLLRARILAAIGAMALAAAVGIWVGELLRVTGR